MLLVLPLLACSYFFPDDAAQLEALVFSAPASTVGVAQVEMAPEIPSLRPGELVAPPVASEGSLRVLALAPEGADRDPSQVAVVFDRPMVALSDLDASASKVPIRCSPEVGGRARWAGTSTAVLIPEDNRFPMGTEYTCEVPAGTAALDGSTLTTALSWSFGTERPALVRSEPTDGHANWDPKTPIVLRFNQAMDLNRATGAIRVRTADGRDVKTTLRRAEGKQDRPEVLRVDAALAPDTAYELVLDAGLRGAGGPLGLAEAQRVAFRTYPPAAFVDTRPLGDMVDTDSTIGLRFTTPVSAEQVAKKVHVSPAPPDGWNPAGSYESESWGHWTRLLPRTRYTVTVDPGITDIHGQTIGDGRTWSFTTGDADSFVDAPVAFTVLPATSGTTVPIRHRNLSSLQVAVERIDPMTFALDRQLEETWTERDLDGAVVTRLPGRRDNVAALHELDLAPYLTEGRGMVRIHATAPELFGDHADGWPTDGLLQVTDLGTTLKLAPDGAAIWVTRLSDASAVGGATVRLVRGGAVVWTGTTGPDGLAWAEGDLVPDGWSSWSDPLWAVVEQGADVALTRHSWSDGMQPYDFGAYGWFDPEQTSAQLYAFTDRGVYRKGETAHVQLLARERSDDGLRAPQARALSWTFDDANGARLSEGLGELDANGAWAVDVPLPTDGAPGEYALRVSVGAASTYVGIPVRAYRPPAFRLDVVAPKALRAGQDLTATVTARYLFGTPMAGAAAKWSAWRDALTIAPNGWDGWSFERLPADGEWSDGASAYTSLSSGTAKLDAQGQLKVTQAIPAAEITRPYTYWVEASVTDVERQELSNRASVPVHAADAYAAIRAPSSIGTAGAPVEVEVAFVTPEGEGVANTAVTLTAVRRTWDTVREKSMDGTWRWVSTPKDEPAATETVRTAKAGSRWAFTPTKGGWFVVRADAKDAAGRATTAETGVWVSGGDDVSWARSDARRLELSADKKRYAPGDTAKILVRSPKRGMRALVTVERAGVWSRKVVTLASTSDTLTVPITAEMMPNAFVSVLAVDGMGKPGTPDAGNPSAWYGLLPIDVDPSEAVLDVTVASDRDAYAPRDEVVVTAKVARRGKPLAGARVTLWAVDHGVLSLTAYETPDPHASFYAKRGLSVLTADNRIAVYDRATMLAKGGETGGGGGASDGDARRLFETTPLWAPSLRTGPDGTLTHRFTLPDNLTTFRIMAVVDDGASAFGKAASELRVNRPLIARPALPRFFRTGDRALAGIVVHNNTEAGMSVDVAATATGATLNGAPRKVTVPAGGALEVPFAITTFTGKDVAFRFEVSGGGHRDAVEVSVPVSEPLPQEVVASAGSTTSSAQESVTVPPTALSGIGGLDVEVSASALVGSGASLSYLLDYPHGCLEQTGSALRVALLARELGAKAGTSVPDATLDGYIRAGLARMPLFRTASGGFAYWPGDAWAYGPASAYALEVLVDARQRGHDVPDATIDALVRYVRRFVSGEERPPEGWSEEALHAARARAALSLARAGRGDAAFNSRAWERRAALPNHARAQLLEAIGRTTGADARTRALTQDLLAAVHVEPTRAALVERDAGLWRALWYGDDLPTSALLRGMLASDPDNALVPRLAAHLVQARRKGRWQNTYTTAEAMLALSEYARRYETGAVRATVSLGAKELLGQDLGVGGRARARLPMSDVSTAPLTIAAQGGRAYYEARLAYALPELPPRDEGFTLVRTYELLEGDGKEGAVTSGALMRVSLRVTTPVDRYDVALVDWLPAGLEPVDTSFATTARGPGGPADTGRRNWDTGDTMDDAPRWFSTWVFNRRELHDDRVAYYASQVPAGVHVLSYVVRATTPGDYAQPAATIEEMYAPETFGRTAAGRFVVGAAPRK